MQVFGYSRLAIVATFLTLLGAGLWFGAKWRQETQQQTRAQQLFSNKNDAEALRALSRETREVRIAYLRLALAMPERVNPHEITVALTQIDRAEAHALYEAVIRPALIGDANVESLLLAFDLIHRWDVPEDAAIRDAAKRVAADLVQSMLIEKDGWRLRSLDQAIAMLPKFDGQALANRLLDAAQLRTDLAGLDSLLRAARTLHDTPAVRNRAVSMLAGRAHAGLDVDSLVGLALAIGDLDGDAVPIAQLLVSRIGETREAHELAMLASGLLAVGPGVPVDTARPMANAIGERVLRESDPAALVRLVIALHGVSHGFSDAEAASFAARIRAKMRDTDAQAKLRFYDLALHAVEDRVPEVAPRPEPGAPADPLTLLDPLLPEPEWTQTALRVLGQPQADDEPSLEELAGVDDNDGDDAEVLPHVDFNALSDALATLRRTPTPRSPATRP